eukprot:gnl/MRDRNA2_/MRDRNA2_214808_c0_seq1.p1 gnl/MRDRNA2_/MRDRNA2_214808_c0~~gnl/MRDRNA2_/MRDRNA2_214808_c0_seq1.p1  ORF type:complete len:290 (-),score=48.38 gnl/MRDRNA2_/MRDRNA2_214808_c0_seq1:141-1010(-)
MLQAQVAETNCVLAELVVLLCDGMQVPGTAALSDFSNALLQVVIKTPTSLQRIAYLFRTARPDNLQMVTAQICHILEGFHDVHDELIDLGMYNMAEHLDVLVKEIMATALAYHDSDGFTDNLVSLCVQAQDTFKQVGINFRRALLNVCQQNFEQVLRPVTEESKQGAEPIDDEAAAALLKNKRLGTVKFTASLLSQGMVASSVFLAVAEDLISEPCFADGLICLCVFITEAGPVFDTPAWQYHGRLNNVFQAMRAKSTDERTASYIRVLLQDVLDLRASGWACPKHAAQ